MIQTMVVRPCPICRKPVAWEANSQRPFCSARCRIKDLGAWASGAYALPEPLAGDDEEPLSQAPSPDMLDP